MCCANQWTGFYMIGTSIMKELRNVMKAFWCIQFLNKTVLVTSLGPYKSGIATRFYS